MLVIICPLINSPAGVGRKVADCVALFSLDKHDVVPVDTHVWDIACRMKPGLAVRVVFRRVRMC